MSYILEALKKAEQKREQEQSAGPVAFSGDSGVRPKRRLWWPYALVLALLLNAGILMLWTTPWQPDPPPAPRGVASQTPAAAAPAPPVERPPQPVEAQKAGELSPPAVERPAVAEKPPVVDRPAATVPPRAQEPPPPTLKPRAPSAEGPGPQSPPTARIPGNPPPPNRIMSFQELPPAVRGSLPAFTISGHAYGPEPQTRVVRVNDKILQEGQELTPGLKVEEIIPEGIVLSFQGYRFRLPVSGNR